MIDLHSLRKPIPLEDLGSTGKETQRIVVTVPYVKLCEEPFIPLDMSDKTIFVGQGQLSWRSLTSKRRKDSA